MRVAATIGMIFTVAAAARASGPELVEQSPAGVALAGAQAAEAGAAAAVYYNPAALALQSGLTLQAGGAAVLARASATGSGNASDGSAAFGVPAVFIGQRISARYAVGVGVYEPFAWSRAWPATFAGRLQGLSFDWRAVAVTPAFAVRPRGWFALGLAIDIVPTTITLRRSVIEGSFEGERLIDSSGTGIGGNAGLLFHALPRRLDVAVAYRSAMLLSLGGTARTTSQATANATPEANATASLPTPHAFTFAVAARPLPGLTLTTDLRVSLWHTLPSLLFTLATPGAASTTDTTPLAWRDTVGIRVGVQYGLWRDASGEPRLLVRAGGGFEQSPAGAGMMSPLLSDGDRGIVSGGFGVRLGLFSVEAGYAVSLATTRAGYAETTHLLSAAVTARLPDFLYHVNEPEFRR